MTNVDYLAFTISVLLFFCLVKQESRLAAILLGNDFKCGIKTYQAMKAE